MLEPRDITTPQPGFWAVRLVGGGPEVPAAIMRLHTRSEPGNFENVMDRSPFLAGFLAGNIVTPSEIWERRGRVIDVREYAYLADTMEWDKANDPRSPLARPHERIDLKRQPAIYPPGAKP